MMDEATKKAARERLYGHQRLCEQERTKRVQREDHIVQCFRKGALLPEPSVKTTETMDSFAQIKPCDARDASGCGVGGAEHGATTRGEGGVQIGNAARVNRAATSIHFGWDKAPSDTQTSSDFTVKGVTKKTFCVPEDLYETHLADLSSQYREQTGSDSSSYKTEFDGFKSYREWSQHMANNKMKVGRRQTSTLYQKSTHFQLGSEPPCLTSETSQSFTNQASTLPALASTGSTPGSQGDSHVFCRGDYDFPSTTPLDHFLSVKQRDYPAVSSLQPTGKGTNQKGTETSDLRAFFIDRNMRDFKNQRDPTSINMLQAFLNYDKTRSGSFSVPELRAVCQELGIQISTKELEDLLRECDINKDGRIDYMEFITYLTAHKDLHEEEPSVAQKGHLTGEKNNEASYQTATHFRFGNGKHLPSSVYSNEFKPLGQAAQRVHAHRPASGGVMQEYPVFPTGTSITSQHYSAYNVPSEAERLRGGRENKSKQSVSGVVLNSNKSPNESFQSSVTRSTFTPKRPSCYRVPEPALPLVTDFHHLESDRALLHPPAGPRKSEVQESYRHSVSKEEGMEMSRKSLTDRKSRISDNKQAHFHLGFDNEKRLTENMAEFSPRKPIDPSLPAAGKSNGLAAKHSVMALGPSEKVDGLQDLIQQKTFLRNINPRDPVNMNLRRAFLEYDKDLSGSISKDELLSVCSAINIDVDDKEIQDLIMKCDKRGNGQIDYHEFALHLMRHNNSKPSTEEMPSTTTRRDFKHPQDQRLTPMQKLVWEQEAKRHVPLLPVVLHQGYTMPHTTITRSDFIAPEEVVQSSN
ncbi:hypothetical protein EMCRGX_G032706 [Ephydatia muelleri]